MTKKINKTQPYYITARQSFHPDIHKSFDFSSFEDLESEKEKDNFFIYEFISNYEFDKIYKNVKRKYLTDSKKTNIAVQKIIVSVDTDCDYEGQYECVVRISLEGTREKTEKEIANELERLEKIDRHNRLEQERIKKSEIDQLKKLMKKYKNEIQNDR